MVYKVIFLDGEEGRPLRECEVCNGKKDNEYKRNVIEPVALFVKEEEYEEIKERIKDISEQELNKLIEKNNKLLGQSEQRCIFHCEKENEIWMENFDKHYIAYKQRRDYALLNNFPFAENPPFIKWRKKLVEIFWARIRAYRFFIDNFEQIDHDKSLLGGKVFVEWYLKKFKEKYLSLSLVKRDFEIEYDFKSFIFPKFGRAEFDFLGFSEQLEIKAGYSGYFAKKDYNFWFENESISFNRRLVFNKTIFLDNFFAFIIFYKSVFFTDSIFYTVSDFQLSEFLESCSFYRVHFIGTVDFRNTQFSGRITFKENIFEDMFLFADVRCRLERNVIINFEKNIIRSKCCFDFDRKSKVNEFKIENIFLEKDSLLEIKNLKTETLSFIGLNDVRNSKILLFSNLVLLPKPDVITLLDIFDKKYQNNEIYKKHRKLINDFVNYYCQGEILSQKIKKNSYYIKFFELDMLVEKFISGNISEEELNAQIDAFLLFFEKNKKRLKQIIHEFIENKQELKRIEKKIKDTNDPNLKKILEEINHSLKFSFFIKESFLYKSVFINCDFSEAKNIHIEDSSLTDCEFVNVNWGEITEKRICKELFEKAPEKAQDIYRQLKLAHDNQKDFIHGNDFYALEMRAYDKYLEHLSWLKHFKDKFIFKISKFASNFGQDWVKAFLWIMLLGFVLMGINSIEYKFSKKILDKDCSLSFNIDNSDKDRCLSLNVFLFENTFNVLAKNICFEDTLMGDRLMIETKKNKYANFKIDTLKINNNNNSFYALLLYSFEKIKYEQRIFLILFFVGYFFFLCYQFEIKEDYVVVLKYDCNKDLKCVSIFKLTFLFFFSIFTTALMCGVFANINGFQSGLDFYFVSLAKAYTPWKTLFNNENHHVPFFTSLYFVFSAIIYYLNYQLIISLRRKIRR